jgi:hypothetical protein
MSRPASSDTASPALWFAFFGPAAAWFAALVVSYFAVHEVCRVQSPLAPRIASVLALLVSITAGVVGRGIWLRAESHERTRFMAQIGVIASGVFSLIILLQVVATLFLPSCHERPRTHQSPDVFIAPQAEQLPPT